MVNTHSEFSEIHSRNK